jgi:ABC-2 type transport system ATP-binding protein
MVQGRGLHTKPVFFGLLAVGALFLGGVFVAGGAEAAYGAMLDPSHPEVHPLLAYPDSVTICYRPNPEGPQDVEGVYLAWGDGCAGLVSPRDVRLSSVGPYDPGSVVRTGDIDRGEDYHAFPTAQIHFRETQGEPIRYYLAYCLDEGCQIDDVVAPGWLRLAGDPEWVGVFVYSGDSEVGLDAEKLAILSEFENRVLWWDITGRGSFIMGDGLYWFPQWLDWTPQPGTVRLGADSGLGPHGEVLDSASPEVRSQSLMLERVGGTVCLLEYDGVHLVYLVPHTGCPGSIQPGDYRLSQGLGGMAGSIVDEDDVDVGSPYFTPSDVQLRLGDSDGTGRLSQGDSLYLCAPITMACGYEVAPGWVRLTHDGDPPSGTQVKYGEPDLGITTDSLMPGADFVDLLWHWDCDNTWSFEGSDVLYLQTWGQSGATTTSPYVRWVLLGSQHVDPVDPPPCQEPGPADQGPSGWGSGSPPPPQDPEPEPPIEPEEPPRGEPVAVFEFTQTDRLEVLLDATESYHTLDGQIVSYRWLFQGGTSVAGPRVTWEFEDPGPHHVILRIVDEYGKSDTQRRTIELDESWAGPPGSSQGQGQGNWFQQDLILSWLPGNAVHWVAGWIAFAMVGLLTAGAVASRKARNAKSALQVPERMDAWQAEPVIQSGTGQIAVRTHDLVVVKRGQVILNGVRLNVPRGSFTLLVGPSGSGKSTLVRSLMGLQKYRGHVEVLGERSDVARAGLKGRVGYVPQDLQLFPDLNVAQNILYFAENQGLRPMDAKAKVPDLLRVLGLEESARRNLKELSGGQKRRVSIACALVSSPEVLFMDEPTSGLDFSVRRDLCSLLQDLVARRGITIIATTHYLDEARYSGQIAIMHQGRLVASGTLQDLARDLPGRGRTVEARFESLDKKNHAVLKKTLDDLKKKGWIESYDIYGYDLRILCKDPAKIMLKLPAHLAENGIPPASTQLDETRIEDIFVAHTGKRFEAPRS